VGGADFSGAAFGGGANFDEAFFKSWVEFTGKSKEQLRGELAAKMNVMDAGARTALESRHVASWVHYDSGPDRFLAVSFTNARFDGEADFSGRSFERDADFTNARFYRPPNFDLATNIARIDFTGAYIGYGRTWRPHWTSNTKIPIRLRALRKIAEDTKNHDLERDLYIEERKAERGVYLRQRFNDLRKESWKNWPPNIARLFTHILWIAVMGIYWLLADYGRSFARPAVCWLVMSLIIFPWLYGQILPVPQKAGSIDADKYEHAVQMVARANAVPFVGPLTIDSDIKKFLFCLNDKDCHPIPPECYQWLVIAQNLFSITCVFFIGLALRNYFKIK
jgi:hypothetical protein